MTYNLEQIANELATIHTETEKNAHEASTDVICRILSNENEGTVISYSEFVHEMYMASPINITRHDIGILSDNPVAFYAISSGLMENEDDTADILYVQRGFYNIIDVKTRNLDKNAQPPNIISAYKLAQMCAYMIENEEYDSISIDYIGINWREDKENGKLVCEGAQHVCLFKIQPDDLYINWAAALQVQFHPHTASQSWEGNTEEWARGYLRHFVDSARKRCDTMRAKFIDPFLKYIDEVG